MVGVHIRRPGAVAALVLLASCSPKPDDPNPDYPAVDGDYFWYGSGLAFVDGKYGVSSEASGMATHATVARLFSDEGQLVLDIPPCRHIVLERSGERGQILTAAPQLCELDPIQVSLGVNSRTLTALRIDLDGRVMHQRYCQSGGPYAGCGGTDSMFVPLASASEGGGGADGMGGEAPVPTVEDTESEAIWAFVAPEATLWVCDELAADAEGCASGDGLMDHRSDAVAGTVHRLRDGRFYFDGFDCFAPADYEGPPISCQQALDGIGTPVPWVSRFIVTGDHLSFEAEMVGLDYLYYVRLEAELTLLSELVRLTSP